MGWWVGGEPRKTAGPTTRGAAGCRTLQEGPHVWVGGEPGKTAGPTLRGAGRCRTLQEGPNMYRGLAVSPGKPRVPYCEERPGAAHSRRDQNVYCGLAVSPGTPPLSTAPCPSSPSTRGRLGVSEARPRCARRHSSCRVDRYSQLSGAQAVS